MRKGIVFSVAVMFLIVGVSAVGWAAQNVANPSQKGSLLIFPKIEVGEFRDTLVEINNDSSKNVNVKCYWVDEYQKIEDFEFILTRNQPVWLSARSGSGMMGPKAIEAPPFIGARGELKCWAVDMAGINQISFNHLYGNATIFNYYSGQAYEYNSWNFIARGVALGLPVGNPGEILLTGQPGAYDACPQFLATDFVAKGGVFPMDGWWGDGRVLFGLETDLTLVPCKQDLRQDRFATVTKAKYDIWNEDEVKYTGAYQCFKCFFEGVLSDTQKLGFGEEKFTADALHSSKGRLRIQGIKSAVCDGKFTDPIHGNAIVSVDSPLLGVSAKTFVTYNNDLTTYFQGGSNLNTAGADPTGFIKYDPAGDVPESPAR